MIGNRLPYRMALALLAAVLFAYVLYPQVAMISGTLQVDGRLSLGHYTHLLDMSNSANAEAVVNSIAVSILSVVLGALVGGLFAFTFTFRFPFRTTLSRLAVLPLALPPLVGVISFLFVFGESGLLPRILQKLLLSAHVPFYLDGFGAIVAIHVYSFYVYFYLFLSNSLKQLDSSLVEAASSLGSTQWNTFRRVVLPELRPALVGASILTFMASMASFSAPLIFGGERRFLTTQIYATKLNGELDAAAAQSVLLTLVSIGFFLLFTLSNRSSPGAGKTKGTPRRMQMRVSSVLKRTLILITVVLLAVELLPILSIVVISFVRESSWTWQVFPTEFSIENYAKLFLDQRVFEPIQNSMLMALLTVLAAVLVGVSASFVIVKGGLKRLRVPIDLLLTLSFAIPGTVVAISLIYAFNKPTLLTGNAVLVGTFWILPLAYFIRTYPLVVRATSASLERLDDSLMEAGETFGATLPTRLRKIALPIILPGVISGSLLVAIAALGEFVSSIMLYTYSSRPISMEILSQLRGYNFGAATAYSVFLLIVIFLLIVLSHRLSRRKFEDGGLNF